MLIFTCDVLIPSQKLISIIFKSGSDLNARSQISPQIFLVPNKSNCCNLWQFHTTGSKWLSDSPRKPEMISRVNNGQPCETYDKQSPGSDRTKHHPTSSSRKLLHLLNDFIPSLVNECVFQLLNVLSLLLHVANVSVIKSNSESLSHRSTTKCSRFRLFLIIFNKLWSSIFDEYKSRDFKFVNSASTRYLSVVFNQQCRNRKSVISLQLDIASSAFSCKKPSHLFNAKCVKWVPQCLMNLEWS